MVQSVEPIQLAFKSHLHLVVGLRHLLIGHFLSQDLPLLLGLFEHRSRLLFFNDFNHLLLFDLRSSVANLAQELDVVVSIS